MRRRCLDRRQCLIEQRNSGTSIQRRRKRDPIRSLTRASSDAIRLRSHPWLVKPHECQALVPHLHFAAPRSRQSRGQSQSRVERAPENRPRRSSMQLELARRRRNGRGSGLFASRTRVTSSRLGMTPPTPHARSGGRFTHYGCSARLRVCRVPSSNGRAAGTPPDCGRDARTPWCAWGEKLLRPADLPGLHRGEHAAGGVFRSRLRNSAVRSGGVARCFLGTMLPRCDKQNATLILATSARPTGRANQR